ncbi:MAG: hypothetical protein L0210_02110 [Rhodospirillales bacterium]|nr:hypothetical protein [Rhodospirillales bacterium]
MAALSGIFGLLLAVLGFWLGSRISYAAAFIGIGIGLYAGVWTGGFIADWYSPYATSDDDLFTVDYASALGSGLLWAVLLAAGGYLLGQCLERRLEPAALRLGGDLGALRRRRWRYTFPFHGTSVRSSQRMNRSNR